MTFEISLSLHDTERIDALKHSVSTFNFNRQPVSLILEFISDVYHLYHYIYIYIYILESKYILYNQSNILAAKMLNGYLE